MKKQLWFVILALGLLRLSASAETYTNSYSVGNVKDSGTSLNATIPDGQYPMGISSSIDVSGAVGVLSSITVTLNITGGWNGDLYAYLYYDGTRVMLLNQVGTGSGDQIQYVAGYSTSGFNNITLADDGLENIHDVESPVSGTTYSADGGLLSSFDGLDANGTWTLFLADESQDGQSTLVGWSMEIVTVPEPSTLALVAFAALLVGVGLTRKHLCSHAPRPQLEPLSKDRL